MRIRTSDHQIGNLMALYLTTELSASILIQRTLLSFCKQFNLTIERLCNGKEMVICSFKGTHLIGERDTFFIEV